MHIGQVETTGNWVAQTSDAITGPAVEDMGPAITGPLVSQMGSSSPLPLILGILLILWLASAGKR